MDVITDEPWARRVEALGSLSRREEAIGIQVSMAEGFDSRVLFRHRLGRVREDPEVYKRRMSYARWALAQELEQHAA